MKKRWLSMALVTGLVGSLFTPATAFAALEDYSIATTAEENKVILDCDMGWRRCLLYVYPGTGRCSRMG